MKLGTLVTGVTYRNPAILAKIVTSLDVISNLGLDGLTFNMPADGHDPEAVAFAGEVVTKGPRRLDPPVLWQLVGATRR